MNDKIIDEIDALVDEQLSGYSERSGYDYNVNQQKCWHCGEDWHGLKITARMREMRDAFLYGCRCDLCQANGGVASDYRYSSDDSEVLCPGSDFIGPWATKRQIDRMRSSELSYLDVGWIQPQGDPLTVRLQATYAYAFPQRYVLGASPSDGDPYVFGRDFDWGDPLVRTQARVNEAFDQLRALGLLPEPITLPRWLVGDPEPDTRTPQERALPRPSTTPPMWAVDAGRQRRTRTNSRRRHR